MIAKQTEAKLLAFVANAFKNKLDKGGEPYFYHCLTVANRVKQRMQVLTENELLQTIAWQAALGHDLIEDCNLTNDDLYRAEFDLAARCIIERLSKRKDQSYEDYIQTLIERAIEDSDDLNKITILIKLEGLHHNCEVERLSSEDRRSEKTLKRLEKYRGAIQKLNLIDIDIDFD